MKPSIPAPDDLVPGLAFAETPQWFVCGTAPRVRQGWKLYVALSLLNARPILEAVVPRLASAGVHFKYVKDVHTLRKLNAGSLGYSQVGKCLVVYLNEGEAALVNEIKDLVRPFRGESPEVPYARSFGAGWPLYYRYGSYGDHSIVVAGEHRDDDRTGKPVPEGVTDWLTMADLTEAEVERPVDVFLTDYPVFAAIRQQGKCGIFRGIDLTGDRYRDVVVKLAYPNGQTQPDGSDGCTFLRRELAFYRELRRRGIEDVAPALVDSWDDDRQVAEVLEYVDGRNLLAKLLAGEATVTDLEGAWELIDRVHTAGLVIGDAKIANVLVAADGIARLIDFEAGSTLASGEAPPMYTFDIRGAAFTNAQQFDRAHFLVSVLFDYADGQYSREDRIVDLSTVLDDRPDSAIQAWALRQLDAIF